MYKIFCKNDLEGTISSAIIYGDMGNNIEYDKKGQEIEKSPDIIRVDKFSDYLVSEFKDLKPDDELFILLPLTLQDISLLAKYVDLYRVTWISNDPKSVMTNRDYKEAIPGFRDCSDRLFRTVAKYFGMTKETDPLLKVLSTADSTNVDYKWFELGIEGMGLTHNPFDPAWESILGFNGEEEFANKITEVLNLGMYIYKYIESEYINDIEKHAFKGEFEHRNCLVINKDIKHDTIFQSVVSKLKIPFIVAYHENGKHMTYQLYSDGSVDCSNLKNVYIYRYASKEYAMIITTDRLITIK